jgi:hypothetical protein
MLRGLEQLFIDLENLLIQCIDSDPFYDDQDADVYLKQVLPDEYAAYLALEKLINKQ